jgi:hypothetical protein
MENNEKLVINVDPETVIEQNQKEVVATAPKKRTEFNPKNYLDARLAPGEQRKEITIRLLPFSSEGNETSPFKKIYAHTVKVNKEVSTSGWKTFICPAHNGLNEKCPFCDTSAKARELRFSAPNEAEKKKYGDIEYLNKPKEMWVVRCIDRAHEDEGVKFWRFNHVNTGKGVYDAIYNLFQTRMKEDMNIFDLNEGKDLIITITKDSRDKTVYQVTDKGKQTPLSEDYEKEKAWVYDSKKWDDLFTVKSYDYLSIIVEGGIPVYDKDKKMFVNKEDLQKQQAVEKAEDIKANLEEAEDLSVIDSTVDEETAAVTTNTVSSSDSTYDLPF